MAVGPGMLDAACPGNVFAAPPMEYVLECTRLLNSKKGVLHLINNYTGDRAAWEMARELAEAEDIKIGVVYVNDDVAVINSTWTVGRRGVAGNFFVIKSVGSAAAEGASLEELVKLGEKVVAGVRTMGVAISGCTPPGKDKPIFELADGEMEMGVGIHGEKGRRRAQLPNADAVVDELFDAVSQDIPYNRGDEVALMINGLGGTPPSELYLLYRRAAIRCRDAGYSVVRNYVGNYCTSLEMAGFSLTLLKLDDELKKRLDAPAEIAFRIF
jgi:dihydroxyacetone kinase-like protein